MLSLKEFIDGDEGMKEVLKIKPQPAKEKPMPFTYIWLPEFLSHGIPKEYRNAKLSDKIKEVLKRKPVSLCLLGPPGTGKTHMLWALKLHLRAKRIKIKPGEKVEPGWTKDGEYERKQKTVLQDIAHICEIADLAQVIDEPCDIRSHRFDHKWLKEQIAYPNYLGVDDIGCMEPNEWVKEAIYNISNQRRANQTPTLWTSNLTRQQFMSTFGAAISSRVLGGEVIELSGKDKRLS